MEGARWLTELAQMAQPPSLIFYTEAWYAEIEHRAILQQFATPGYLVSEAVMGAMSDTVTPPGILAVVPVLPRPLPASFTLLLILDRIKTPGNLGTILRSAAAAGVDGVLLAPGCVDPYNPKAVRGGMGAQLRLPVHSLSWPEIQQQTAALQVWLATAAGEHRYTHVNWRRPSALIIGGEAAGPTRQAEAVADGQLYIPMHARTESLNAAVAASIILFVALRQRSE